MPDARRARQRGSEGSALARRREKAQLRAAELAGTLAGLAGRGLPGVLGPALVAIGLGLAWLPLGVIAAGAVLWLVDLRIPDPQPQQRSGDPRRPRPRGLRAVS